MITALCRFLLFVFLSLHFTANKAFEEHYNHDDHLPNVRVLNALPKNTEPIRLKCSSPTTSQGSCNLGVGDNYSWKVEEKVLHRCEAFWELKFASWHAFQPERDVNHTTVFWLVTEKGFLLSWDNSTWVKKSTWETE